MTKSFYDDSETVVLDALEALALTQPDLSFDKSTKVIWRPDFSRDQVSLLSGGGAGHEPAHAGYVGNGMLTAAVSGSIFASPSVAQIVSGIKRIAGPCGVLLIIKNYTGDMFHFHLAAEKAKASLGISVEILVVADDVAVGRRKSGKVGRRGLAGAVLVHKILGAYSCELATTLEDLLKLGTRVTNNMGTVGASLEHVHIPGRKVNVSPIKGQVEVGMGIHNEPGSQVLSPRPSLSSLIDTMLTQLLDMGDVDRGYVDFSDAEQVVLLVNNLGGVSELELGGITTNVVRLLARRNIQPTRVLYGTYMTSLNGLGFSITLLKATPDMIYYIDAPTDTRGWIPATTLADNIAETHPSAQDDVTPLPATTGRDASGSKFDLGTFKRVVLAACERVISAEPEITDYDCKVGDGDCGITLARGARAIREHVPCLASNTDAAATIAEIAEVIENNMDGTSGAIYSIFFAAYAAALQIMNAETMTPKEWIDGASVALGKLQQATPARQGDRTMMDALEPFVTSLSKGLSVDEAVQVAKAGAEATKGMNASLGRAVYVESSAWDQVPDPGAIAVVCLLEGLQSGIAT